MNPPNPLHIANTAQHLARNASGSDAAVFNRVSMVCMGIMAAAAAMQILQPILRDLNHQNDSRDIKKSGRCV